MRFTIFLIRVKSFLVFISKQLSTISCSCSGNKTGHWMHFGKIGFIAFIELSLCLYLIKTYGHIENAQFDRRTFGCHQQFYQNNLSYEFIDIIVGQCQIMTQNQPERMDSQVIRQGLLSIRNSQIELLNQLKSQTQQLKKTPMRFNTSTEDSHSEPPSKMDNYFSYPPENTESIVKFNPPSPTAVQKPFSFGLQNQRQYQSEISHLKDQNKMLKESLQKTVYSRSLDKERVRELESYLYFSSKINYQIINQILYGASMGEVKRAFQNDLRINEDIYSKYQESNHELILELLRDKQNQVQPFRVGNVPSSSTPRDPQVNSQLEELKTQIVMLMKTNQKSDFNPVVEAENTKLKQQRQILIRKCEQMQEGIIQYESDNKELALCWQRQINQRKALIADMQKTKKDKSVNEEMERQFSFMQTDLEAQLVQAQDLLRQKNAAAAEYQDKIRQLSDTVTLLREENQKLKRQIKSVQELRMVIKEENLEVSRSRQNQLSSRIAQQSSMMGNFERQNIELKSHLAELRRRFEVMSQMQVRNRETEIANQEMAMRKMHIIKTNTTVQHLWQVKRVQFENINELLQELKDKNLRA